MKNLFQIRRQKLDTSLLCLGGGGPDSKEGMEEVDVEGFWVFPLLDATPGQIRTEWAKIE